MSIKNHPNFIREETELEVVHDTNFWNHRRFFRFDAKSVELSYTTRRGPDTGATLLLGADIKIENLPTQGLCESQCIAFLAGEYALLHLLGGGLEVVSLKTGSSMFGPLTHALWIDEP